jgi:hypothetical protein
MNKNSNLDSVLASYNVRVSHEEEGYLDMMMLVIDWAVGDGLRFMTMEEGTALMHATGGNIYPTRWDVFLEARPGSMSIQALVSNDIWDAGTYLMVTDEPGSEVVCHEHITMSIDNALASINSWLI